MDEAKDDAGADPRPEAEREAEILFPEREVAVAGETVTVREFGFRQALRLSARAKPLVEALHDALPTDGGEIDMLALESAFAAHEDITAALMAEATGRPVEWIDALGDRDGRQLLLTFWSVNRHFFLNRMMTLSLNRLTGQVWPSRWRH